MRVKIRVFLIKENAKLLKINDLAFFKRAPDRTRTYTS